MVVIPPPHVSCQDSEPLIKLQENAKPPTLNYNLPQSNSFATYNAVAIDLLDADFSTDADMPLPLANTTPLTASTLRELLNGTRSPNTSGVRVSPFQVGILASIFKKLDATGQQSMVDRFTRDLNEGGSVFVDTGLSGTSTVVTIPMTQNLAYEPAIVIVQEFKTVSYLGEYGAGKVASTFSLFPGEKTTITLKTFKERKETQTKAENIIDSFSQESATEMEKLVEDENKKDRSIGVEAGASASKGISFNPVKAVAGAIKKSVGVSVKASRSSSVRNLNKSLEKHVSKSNANRSVEIKNTQEVSTTESEELSTVREFSNPNQSRVLNFVFRTLGQEHIVITYLNDIKIGFRNGHPDCIALYPLQEMDALLEKYLINDAARNKARTQILHEITQIENYQSQLKTFVNPKTGTRLDGTSYTYYEKDISLKDDYIISSRTEYRAPNAPTLDKIDPNRIDWKIIPSDGFVSVPMVAEIVPNTVPVQVPVRTVGVNGVILSVDRYTLTSPAVIVEALLGQGEALDCYAKKIQDEVVRAKQLENDKSQLENDKQELILKTLALLTNPVERANMIAKLFNPAPKEIITNNSSVNTNIERVENNNTRG